MIDDLHVTIPGIIPTLVVGYLVVGVALWAPLNIWAGRFISGDQGNLVVNFVKQGRRLGVRRILASIVLSTLVWPAMLKELVGYEIRFGLGKRYYERKKARS